MYLECSYKINPEIPMKRIAALILVIFSIAMANAQRVTDQFDRGVVAINKGNNQVFISWRFLATDPDDIAFNIYRQGASATRPRAKPAGLPGATRCPAWRISATVPHLADPCVTGCAPGAEAA